MVASVILGSLIFSTITYADATTNRLDDINNTDYVLYLPDGGYIFNEDGSDNFTNEQLTKGEVITGEELKEEESKSGVIELPSIPTDILKASKRPTFRASGISNDVYTLGAGQTYVSQKFSGSGLRYSGYSFYPDPATGPYLLWQAVGDSGLVGPAGEIEKHRGVSIYPGVA
ncbi:hypothetical protein CAC02_04030 [Streptococcus gallolyticus]|uniref:Uncharacterized protein n=1 Tax=Streptococcus gallolyticus TaxID=315405 RepID=A0A368UEC2_9STRE|nr:hypothetical protein [Streptococcus gallolyticus]RCW17295.1 hypothetical protein CAC02_04030 [Streptococcus gallolyticus]